MKKSILAFAALALIAGCCMTVSEANAKKLYCERGNDGKPVCDFY